MDSIVRAKRTSTPLDIVAQDIGVNGVILWRNQTIALREAFVQKVTTVQERRQIRSIKAK